MNGNKARIGMSIGACLILILLTFFSLRNMDLEEKILSELTFVYENNGQTIGFPIWKDKTVGKYYLFLPSWFSGKENQFSLHYDDRLAKVKIDGIFYPDGGFFQDDGRKTESRLEVSGILGAIPVDTTLQILWSEKLPSIFIEIDDPDRVMAVENESDKRHFETGSMSMVDENGDLLCQGELEKFKVRGNLTATLGKKPFTFTLKQPLGLLGMDPAVKWNLLANATDGAYIRNKIIRDLANECIDTYEPSGEFAEVYLNGAFQGLYLLTEAVEVGENRLEIDLDKNWFIEMELEFRTREDPTRMITDRGQSFLIHSERIVTEPEIEEILKRLNDIESALYAEDGVSKISGRPLQELLDLRSFAKAWLVEELSGDHDVGIASQFAYASKEEDSLCYAGPTWDFDGIMGNVNKPMYAVPEALTGMVEQSGAPDDKNQNRWLSAMWRHPEFQKLVKEEYTEVFRGVYEEILAVRIDSYVDQIRKSAVLDAFRWHKNRLDWFFVIPEGVENGIQDSYEGYDTLDECLAVVRDFMERKLVFLDKLWIEDREFCIVEVRNPASFLDQGYNQTLYFWVEKGTPIDGLPCYETEEWQFEGYYDKEDGNLIYDGFVIESDRIIEGCWTQKEGE